MGVFYVGKSCKIPYASGSLSGFFSQDNIRIGDAVIEDQVASWFLETKVLLHFS